MDYGQIILLIIVLIHRSNPFWLDLWVGKYEVDDCLNFVDQML